MSDDQKAFQRDVVATALEFLEFARQAHHAGSLDVDAAWEDCSADDPTVMLAACVYAIEAAVGLGSHQDGFDARLGVVREALKSALSGGGARR